MLQDQAHVINAFGAQGHQKSQCEVVYYIPQAYRVPSIRGVGRFYFRPRPHDTLSLLALEWKKTHSLLIHLVNRYLRIYYTLRSCKRIHPNKIHIPFSNIKFSLFFGRNKLALTNKLELLGHNRNIRIVALRLTQKLNS